MSDIFFEVIFSALGLFYILVVIALAVMWVNDWLRRDVDGED